MLQLAQSLNLNPIKNLQYIIKIRVSAQKQQIYSLNEMKKIIQEKFDKLTKEDFCKYIESMPKHYQLVILIKDSFVKY